MPQFRSIFLILECPSFLPLTLKMSCGNLPMSTFFSKIELVPETIFPSGSSIHQNRRGNQERITFNANKSKNKK